MSRGNARALATNWFGRSKADGGAGTSATDIFDPVDGVTMLGEHTIPFHVGPVGNGLSTGSEHCGSVNLTTDQWLSPDGKAMLDRSARRQAQRAHTRGWSLADCRWLTITEVASRKVHGFCTHNDIRLALGGTTHTDPGRNFPYSWYMERIRFWYVNPNGISTPALRTIERITMALFANDAERAEFVNAVREGTRGAHVDLIRLLDDTTSEIGGRGRAVAVDYAQVIKALDPPAPTP